MGGGGRDWQDSEREKEQAAIDFYDTHTCSLDFFSDQELIQELETREMKRIELEKQEKMILEHNAPLLREIQTLKEKLDDLNSRLLK